MSAVSSRLISLLVATFLMLPGLPAVAQESNDDLVFNGSGWGHGVGMSQYGAYGMARNGHSATSIIKHYYQGTTVADVSQTSAAPFLSSDPDPLWIGLVQDQTEVVFSLSGGGATLCQGWNSDCPKSIRPKAGETWRFYANSQSKCIFEKVGSNVAGDPGSCDASVRPDDGATLNVDPHSYSSGVLRFRQVPSTSGTFHASLEIAIQPYLGGIVEVFMSWPPAALEAQVIASRSYALSNATARGPESKFSSTVKELCWCHLYDDSRSQNFKGDHLLGYESWQSAVANTEGKVISYEGTLVTAFYSSSSGGWTENVEHVWGGTPRPWLVSVDDSWAHLDEVKNPRSSWTVVRTRAHVAEKLGLDILHKVAVHHRTSGGVSSVEFVGEVGGGVVTISRSGTSVRSLLGLPSHYFSVEITSTLTLSAYDIPQNFKAPIGWFEEASDQVDSARVRGWTLDPDTPLPINIHIYVDGKFRAGLLADVRRPDVEKAFSNGALHGFNLSLSMTPGTHQVCVYAINAPTRTGNPRIGCKTVTVTSTAPAPDESHLPFGWLDKVAVENGQLVLRGWAIDRDAPDQAVGIHVYVDGKFFLGGPADTSRPDVDRAFGLGDHHGFSFDKEISSGSHRVCIYAINLPEKTNNPLLGCKSVG